VGKKHVPPSEEEKNLFYRKEETTKTPRATERRGIREEAVATERKKESPFLLRGRGRERAEKHAVWKG